MALRRQILVRDAIFQNFPDPSWTKTEFQRSRQVKYEVEMKDHRSKAPWKMRAKMEIACELLTLVRQNGAIFELLKCRIS